MLTVGRRVGLATPASGNIFERGRQRRLELARDCVARSVFCSRWAAGGAVGRAPGERAGLLRVPAAAVRSAHDHEQSDSGSG
jgi:hypothetical protein